MKNFKLDVGNKIILILFGLSSFLNVLQIFWIYVAKESLYNTLKITQERDICLSELNKRGDAIVEAINNAKRAAKLEIELQAKSWGACKND